MQREGEVTVVSGREDNLEVDMAGDKSFVILGLTKGNEMTEIKWNFHIEMKWLIFSIYHKKLTAKIWMLIPASTMLFSIS